MKIAPPLGSLFRSDGQARPPAEPLLSRADELNLNELAERAGVAYGSVRRKVRGLLEAGLLSERRVTQVRLVRPNPGSPLTQPVRDLLLVSAGPVPLLAAELRDIAGMQALSCSAPLAARMRGEPGDAPMRRCCCSSPRTVGRCRYPPSVCAGRTRT